MSKDDFDDLLSGHDEGVDLDGEPIKKRRTNNEERITNDEIQEEVTGDEEEVTGDTGQVTGDDEIEEEEVAEEEVAEEEVVEEEVVEEEVVEEVVEEEVAEKEKEEEEEQHVILSEAKDLSEPTDSVLQADEAAQEEPSESTEILRVAQDDIEEPTETDKVIEEIKEKVTASRTKQKPKKHDAEAEQLNKRNENNDQIVLKEIGTVMHESMIPYSEFVIMDRALPRVEDGLKPVQRRILYAMHEMGLTPDKPFRKSAGIVGECLGKFHPHGDTSVYDAMVRLAQGFNVNMPLVLGQGNFGSEDGDPPAAMRYTEAKLEPLAMELLRDIDKEPFLSASRLMTEIPSLISCLGGIRTSSQTGRRVLRLGSLRIFLRTIWGKSSTRTLHILTTRVLLWRKS